MKIAINDPQSDYVQDVVKGVVGAVEANRFEESALWQNNRRPEYSPVSWVESRSGIGPCVGYVDTEEMKPIFISMVVNEIDEHKILFWYPTGRYVDYDVIDEYLKKALPDALRKNGHLNNVDAQNFHNVLPRKAIIPSESAPL